MKDSHQDKRVHTRNDTDKGCAERHDTRQSATRPGRAPQDHPGARAMLKATAPEHGKHTQGGKMKGKKCKGKKPPRKHKGKSREKRINPGDKTERQA